MSGYTRLPTYNPDNSKYDSDADVSGGSASIPKKAGSGKIGAFPDEIGCFVQKPYKQSASSQKQSC